MEHNTLMAFSLSKKQSGDRLLLLLRICLFLFLFWGISNMLITLISGVMGAFGAYIRPGLSVSDVVRFTPITNI
jgi:hypothetical protein